MLKYCLWLNANKSCFLIHIYNKFMYTIYIIVIRFFWQFIAPNSKHCCTKILSLRFVINTNYAYFCKRTLVRFLAVGCVVWRHADVCLHVAMVRGRHKPMVVRSEPRWASRSLSCHLDVANSTLMRRDLPVWRVMTTLQIAARYDLSYTMSLPSVCKAWFSIPKFAGKEEQKRMYTHYVLCMLW